MTGYDLYKIAKKHIREGGAKARAYCGLPSGAPWCNAYVCYIFNEGGVRNLYYGGKKVTYCPTSIKWCQTHLAQIPLYLAMPMDVIYFDWNNNNVPDHIGFVKQRNNTSTIFTHEGNTNGGIVYEKERPSKYVMGVFRPHYQPPSMSKSKLNCDGIFGYKSIYMLQVALGLKPTGILTKDTVKALQKYVGVYPDGAWGRKTSVAVQKKLCGFSKPDGLFGKQSVTALQKWINNKCYPTTKSSSSTTKPTTSKPTTSKPTTTPTTTKPTTTKPTTKTPSKTTKTTKPTLKSYKISIDLTNQICTVYGVYSDGSLKGIMSEFVSTARKGKTTPIGNFKIQGASGGLKAKYRTCKLSGGKTYAEYACRFKGAKMMHGVPYKTRNTKGYVYKNEFNKLGSVASAGCVRMPIKMARFIYNNCPIGTPVVVFKGKAGNYPMGKPKKYTATSNVDPTK